MKDVEGGENMKDILVKFRKERGMSTQDMADALGISKSWYEKIEYEQRKPSREFMLAFKKAFPMFDVRIFFDELLHE